jgi:hypothetical protein
MSLRVSTTGADVLLADLGIQITHPTVDLDLTEQFTAIDLRNSADLTAAIGAGDLDVDDGTNFIHKDDYDPDAFLIQELGYDVDEFYVSHDELASVNNILINKTGVFPLALSSTASVTRNVYSPAARFIFWQLEPGDIVVISGSTAADGTYTVESITDQQNFIVVESIPDSTGGTTNIYHPGGATRVGVDPAGLSWTSATDLQTVLDELTLADEKVRVTANDAAPGFLLEQLEAGTGVTIVEVDDGGDEKARISVTPSAGQFDPNTMVLDCDGSLVYIGEGDIVICDDPLPGPVTDTNC